MTSYQSAMKLLLGPDRKLQRMVQYSLVVLGIYSFCTWMLWLELPYPGHKYPYSVAVTTLCVAGAFVFCILVRLSKQLGLTPRRLASWQGYHAMICIVAAYPVAPPVRGALLIFLVVVVVFCAFSLSRRGANHLVLFAIILTGAVMAYMASYDPVTFPPAFEIVHFSIAASMLVVVSFLASQLNALRTKVTEQKRELMDAFERIQLMASQDDLTALPNRRYMSEVMEKEEKRHRVTRETLCVALIDIDFFKQINDRYGHTVGDQVQKGFASRFRDALRGTDIIARWGGEEFLFLLPETDLATAASVMDRIHSELSSVYVPFLGTHLDVTFSAGLTRLDLNGTMGDAIFRADAAMYHAKQNGRNKVHVVDLAC